VRANFDLERHDTLELVDVGDQKNLQRTDDEHPQRSLVEYGIIPRSLQQVDTDLRRSVSTTSITRYPATHFIAHEHTKHQVSSIPDDGVDESGNDLRVHQQASV